jgi:hypothetical protein
MSLCVLLGAQKGMIHEITRNYTKDIRVRSCYFVDRLFLETLCSRNKNYGRVTRALRTHRDRRKKIYLRLRFASSIK